ncbi:50S ribosomal protein L29 [Candidatus Cytomitobacter indipagum]|uniref:Large ribosomal subunit protein uL29 n=1 Tax=Candidatus Cytomitobacter indipagum TaxID=2601575 RepID=A0A5C0UEP4_9PROT|nr:50S ribosomal protein L29 [Candidatus Cytomitobacter indipagum]QEK38239.1 50S ribosomal protein L29 [Candidatus Cytomitobacter indipagum]
MQEKLQKLMSSYLESLFLHAKKSLKDPSVLKKTRKEIAKMKTQMRILEVKND